MSVMRAAYTALAFLAIPFAALYLLWRSRKQSEYRAHWPERFGLERYSPHRAPIIWIHAVSLGETRAAEPLIDALVEHYPQHLLLLTHMTPTGRAAGADVAARWPRRVMQSYLPYDLPYAVRRFLRAHRPVLGIAMETEVWPNLLAAANEQQVPVALVNARLSEQSYRGYHRFAALMRETMQRLSLVLAQTSSDAERLRRLGASNVDVVGNMKFDIKIDEALVERGRAWKRARGERPVWLFATTREGEESMILDALPKAGSAVVVIVPRHPQRFDEVACDIEARGLRYVRRSDANKSGSDSDLFLGDSLGEMPMYYAAADVAFVGGSLVNVGGHNLIEACVVGTPVVVGPHTFNFVQATADAIGAGAAVRVASAHDAIVMMKSITDDPARRAQMSEAALRFAAAHRGATARTVQRLAPFIDEVVM
ncbi:MAG: lipid IV(A) 3-deoxy-D-manno-octulosonic acid transferase, partial [Burkholderiaceae bacterium]